MTLLRYTAILLPQLLLLLMAGGYFDVLAGWNHSESALNVLMALFVLAPLAAAAWWVALLVANRRDRVRGRLPQPLWPAVILLIEALALDLLILSQARM